MLLANTQESSSGASLTHQAVSQALLRVHKHLQTDTHPAADTALHAPTSRNIQFVSPQSPGEATLPGLPAEEFGFQKEQAAVRQPHAEGCLQGICAPWWPGVPPLQGTRYHKPDLGCHATHLHRTVAGRG